jgi:hypothetical protein
VFLADGGGGGTPSGPSFTGTQTMYLEPSAIPAALKAFRRAHDRVAQKVAQLEALGINPWAHDPVSGETAKQFAERSNGGGGDSAAKVLHDYRDQLHNLVVSLEQAEAAYTAMEGENSARWGMRD